MIYLFYIKYKDLAGDNQNNNIVTKNELDKSSELVTIN